MGRRATVRERLARRLEQLVAGATFHPADLYRHTPHDIRTGCASWSGFGTDRLGIRRSVCSWDTMTACARKTSQVTEDRGATGYAHWEVHGV